VKGSRNPRVRQRKERAMRRTVLRNATLFTRNLLRSAPALAASTPLRPKLFCSNGTPPPVPQNPDDVDNKGMYPSLSSIVPF